MFPAAENRTDATAALRQRSLGVRGLCARENPRGPQSARCTALARRQAALRRQPPGRHHRRDRHSHADKVVSTIDLGGPEECRCSPPRRTAFLHRRLRIPRQFGCSNCHIDATIDGLQWDLEPDGFGKDIVDNRSLENLAGTEPFKWNGGNPDMPTECGPRTEKYFFRSQSFNQQQLTDLVTFVYSLPLSPQPLPPRQRRTDPGAGTRQGDLRADQIQERQADSRSEPVRNCHSGPKYTNQHQLDVGTGKPTDRSPVVDVPQLSNVAYSAPYLHDGSARSLEEIWTVFNPKDTHGVTNDLTKDELNDLIEYLKTL